MKTYNLKIVLIGITCMLMIFNLKAQSNSRTQWFEEAKFGMFIHWGLYSAAEGIWKGEKLRYLNNYAEWIRYRNRISKEEYGTLANRFVWDKIDPEEWVLLAKKSGMKYIIMTAKHHDGVAIWDTKIGNYSLSKLSGSHRDVIKELAEACRKHDMKLGFYYSHWIDWEHPYAWDHNQELHGRVSDEQFNQYWQEKVIPQLSELLTNYGDIALMWFDMWIPYQESIIKKEQLEQVVGLIRKLQPNCLINSRLGLPTDSQNVDFETLGDNVFANNYIDHPWETPGTIAHSWGYNGQEKDWKSTSQLFQSLISNVSLNGGLTLNIGPRADGSVPYEGISRLEEMGIWLKKSGHSIYGAKGLALRSENFDWGYLTSKREQHQTRLYAHIFNWPLDQILRISGIKSTVSKAYYEVDNQEIALQMKQTGSLLHIYLPNKPIDPYVSNILLEYEDTVAIDADIVAESTFGGFSLTAYNLISPTNLDINKYDGKRPTAVILTDEILNWDVYFPDKGTYKIDLSAHNPNDQAQIVSIVLADKELSKRLDPTGKIVVEPNENNYTEEFIDHHFGEVTIKEPGKKRIQLRKKDNQKIWVNRIWLSKK